MSTNEAIELLRIVANNDFFGYCSFCVGYDNDHEEDCFILRVKAFVERLDDDTKIVDVALCKPSRCKD